MNNEPKESDWKHFRALVPDLLERYLEKRNAELIDLLQDDSRTPTERFQAVEERTREEAKILSQCLDGHSRSNMVMAMVAMRGHGMLADDDLEGFSEELREQIRTLFAL